MPQQTAEEFFNSLSPDLSRSELSGIVGGAIPRAYHSVRHMAPEEAQAKRVISRGRPRRAEGHHTVHITATLAVRYAAVIDAWALRYHTTRSGALELIIETLVRCDNRIYDEAI